VLARTHRVLALSLLGHGDSAPAVGGYAGVETTASIDSGRQRPPAQPRTARGTS
jgi:hypothetical protein